MQFKDTETLFTQLRPKPYSENDTTDRKSHETILHELDTVNSCSHSNNSELSSQSREAGDERQSLGRLRHTVTQVDTPLSGVWMRQMDVR